MERNTNGHRESDSPEVLGTRSDQDTSSPPRHQHSVPYRVTQNAHTESPTGHPHVLFRDTRTLPDAALGV